MARSTARSSDQSQAHPSQRYSRSNQKKKNQVRSVEENEGEEDEEGEFEEDGNNGANDEGQDEITRKATALVRLALFNETRRTPLRREEINKRVLGDNTRLFATVFELAQKILRTTFGMELVELMSRADRDREQNDFEPEDNENATGLKKKGFSVGSKTYILRSHLPDCLVNITTETSKELLNSENKFQKSDAGEDAPRPHGAIIDWNSTDQLSGMGILMVILSLILVSGHTMSDPELKTHLKTLGIPLDATIEFTPHAREQCATIETYLSTFIKQGYLDRLKVGTGAPRPTQGKRSRGGNLEEEGASYEWRWGSRAHAEFGERAVADFVAEFMTDNIVKEKEENGVTIDAMKVMQSMKKDIAQAVGGKLNEVR